MAAAAKQQQQPSSSSQTAAPAQAVVGVDVQEDEEELPAFRSSLGTRKNAWSCVGCRTGAAATGALFSPLSF